MNTTKKGIRALLETMPVLRHSLPGEAFDINRSEVVAWLISQPRVKQAVFDLILPMGGANFDKETRTWAGNSVRPPAVQPLPLDE